MLGKIFKWLATDVAIDLGTANTLIYVKSKGILFDEPSVVAINESNKKPIAYGLEAKNMLERTPANIRAIRPMKDGVIADFEVTEQMLKYFIHKATKSKNMRLNPRIVICVPSGVTPVEKRAVRDSAYQAGAREVFILDEAMGAAIGAGLPIQDPCGNMIVDIGGGTTEVAVISLSGIVYANSVRIGGDELNDAIVSYIKKQYNLLVGTLTAENIKIQIGAAFKPEEEIFMEIKGRDLVTGVPKTLEVSNVQIEGAIREPLQKIFESIRVALEKTPPELSADIVDRGIVITGGGALLKDIDKAIHHTTGLPVIIHNEPLLAVVKGAGIVLSNPVLLKKITTT